MTALVQTYTRGNEIDFVCTFTTPALPGVQPTTAKVRIEYPLTRSSRASEVVDLVKQLDDTWTGTWDSSAAGVGGTVNYWVKSSGLVVAAAQGTFKLAANPANYGS